MTSLRLHTVGLATVQDLGRPGLAHLGIAENGAADGWAAQVANTLVGNAVTDPLIEVTGSEFSFHTDHPVLLAVTGAATRVLVDGIGQPSWELLVIAADRTVTIPAPTLGLRSYVAVNGALAAEPVLGSVAPDRLLRLGRPLRSGGHLELATAFRGLVHPYFGVPVFDLGVPPPRRTNRIVIETTPGPESAEFDGQALDQRFEVSAQSDAVGLRLDGPTPPRTNSTEIVSRGVPVGAVEAPPGGGLLVLLRGRLVTAGYPVIAVATRVGVDRLGQARPGDIISFESVDLARAHAALRRRADELTALRDRVNRALRAVGLAEVLRTGLSPAAP